jgi:hypothetical protein
MASITLQNRIPKPFRGWLARPGAPVVGLIAASLIVALAIATNGQLSKTINGVGGLLWIVSAVCLGLRLRSAQKWLGSAVIAFGLTLTLVLLVKPADLLWAAIGFTIGGALMSLAVSGRRLEWTGFLAAIWLPTHLLVALGRVIERSIRDLPANVRTDPPPTAAFVPFAMVICALAGSRLVDLIRAKQNPPVDAGEELLRD